MPKTNSHPAFAHRNALDVRPLGDPRPRDWSQPEVLPLGDQAFVIRAEPVIAADVNTRVLGWARSLDALAPAWLVDRVPSYAALVVLYDCTTGTAEEVSAVLGQIASAEPIAASTPKAIEPVRRVPVLYDPAVAPDLELVARAKGLSIDEVVALHCQPEYRVYMLGFRPGFPYMGIVDPRLEMPRLPSPRVVVDAGAVAIADRQTGIYPTKGPGGWRVLGRTPLSIFRAGALTGGHAFLFNPGDRVRFESIGRARYEELLDENRP